MWPDEARPWSGPFVKALADSLGSIGVEVDVLHIRGWAGRRAYAARATDVLALNRRRRAYDIVHAHYGHSALVAALQLRSPLVISYCGGDLLGTVTRAGRQTRRGRVEVGIFRQLARMSAASVTRTREMEERLPPRLRRRNFVIPSPVDLDRFAPEPREEARRRLGWPADEETVLFANDPRLAVKNYPLAEATCRLAGRSRPRLRLRVAADVPHDAMPTWMNAAHALILPSWYEGSPNAVKEALAVGLPVVATPVGDVAERLDGLEGCYVRPPDADAMAGALVQALGRGRVPEARKAVAPLGLEATARRVREVYELARATSRRSGPRPG